MPGIDLNTVMNGPVSNALVVLGIVFFIVTLLIVNKTLPVVRDLTSAMNRLSDAVNGIESRIAEQSGRMEALEDGVSRLTAVSSQRFGLPALGTVAAVVAVATWFAGRRL